MSNSNNILVNKENSTNSASVRDNTSAMKTNYSDVSVKGLIAEKEVQEAEECLLSSLFE